MLPPPLAPLELLPLLVLPVLRLDVLVVLDVPFDDDVVLNEAELVDEVLLRRDEELPLRKMLFIFEGNDRALRLLILFLSKRIEW